MCPILWATFPSLSMLVTGGTTKLACPCPFCPLLLSNSHYFLQTLLYCSLQQALSMVKSALMTRISSLPSCSISFCSHTSPLQFIPCFINGWQYPGIQVIFFVCVWRSSNGTFLDWGSDATLVPQQKIHFYCKIVVVYEYLQFISTVLSQIV